MSALRTAIDVIGVAIATAAVIFCLAAPARADDNPLGCFPRGLPVCTMDSQGGVVDEFVAAADEAVRAGRRLVVAHDCWSACVIAIDAARRIVCIGRNANIRIHLIRRYDTKVVPYSILRVRVGILSTAEPPFSSDIRAWVAAHSGYRPVPLFGDSDYLDMQYADAIKIWRACP